MGEFSGEVASGVFARAATKLRLESSLTSLQVLDPAFIPFGNKNVEPSSFDLSLSFAFVSEEDASGVFTRAATSSRLEFCLTSLQLLGGAFMPFENRNVEPPRCGSSLMFASFDCRFSQLIECRNPPCFSILSKLLFLTMDVRFSKLDARQFCFGFCNDTVFSGSASELSVMFSLLSQTKVLLAFLVGLGGGVEIPSNKVMTFCREELETAFFRGNTSSSDSFLCSCSGDPMSAGITSGDIASSTEEVTL